GSERLDGRRRLLTLGMHQGDTGGAQELVDVVDIPRWVANLEGGAKIAWERREESREAVVIALEPGRRLEQHRAEPIAEWPRAIEEDRKRLGRAQQLADRKSTRLNSSHVAIS